MIAMNIRILPNGDKQVDVRKGDDMVEVVQTLQTIHQKLIASTMQELAESPETAKEIVERPEESNGLLAFLHIHKYDDGRIEANVQRGSETEDGLPRYQFMSAVAMSVNEVAFGFATNNAEVFAVNGKQVEDESGSTE